MNLGTCWKNPFIHQLEQIHILFYVAAMSSKTGDNPKTKTQIRNSIEGGQQNRNSFNTYDCFSSCGQAWRALTEQRHCTYRSALRGHDLWTRQQHHLMEHWLYKGRADAPASLTSTQSPGFAFIIPLSTHRWANLVSPQEAYLVTHSTN